MSEHQSKYDQVTCSDIEANSDTPSTSAHGSSFSRMTRAPSSPQRVRRAKRRTSSVLSPKPTRTTIPARQNDPRQLSPVLFARAFGRINLPLTRCINVVTTSLQRPPSPSSCPLDRGLCHRRLPVLMPSPAHEAARAQLRDPSPCRLSRERPAARLALGSCSLLVEADRWHPHH